MPADFAEQLAAADASALPRLHAELLGLPASARRTQALARLFRRWGALDPKSALVAAESAAPAERSAAEDAILRGWATTDPDAATAWAGANGNARIIPVVQGLLESDRTGDVIRLMEKLPADSTRTAVVSNLADYFGTHDIAAGIGWFNTLPNGEGRLVAAGTLGRAIAWNETPAKAIAFATSIPGNGGGRNYAYGAVFEELASTWSPAEARAWFSAPPTDANRDLALRTFIPRFVPRFPEEALALLDLASDTATRSSVATTVGNKLGQSSFSDAVEWLVRAGSVESRKAPLQKMATDWARRDAEGTARDVRDSDLTAPEKESLLSIISQFK